MTRSNYPRTVRNPDSQGVRVHRSSPILIADHSKGDIDSETSKVTEIERVLCTDLGEEMMTEHHMTHCCTSHDTLLHIT